MKHSGIPSSSSVWQLRCDTSNNLNNTGGNGGKHHHHHRQHHQQFILTSPGQATCPKSFEMPAGPTMTRPHLMSGAIPPPHLTGAIPSSHHGAFVNIVLKPAAPMTTNNVRPDVIPVTSPNHHSSGGSSGGSGSSSGGHSGGGSSGGGGRRVMCDLCREERKRRKGEWSINQRTLAQTFTA